MSDDERIDVFLRGMRSEMAMYLKTAAGARALKMADYVEALLRLHDETIGRAEAGDTASAALLERLGLEPVTR